MCDSVNNIAERISKFVKNMGEKCESCKKAHTDYQGKCKAYSWDITYGLSGAWCFTLYCHTKEIWYKCVEGDAVDVLLTALEKLNSGEWKK